MRKARRATTPAVRPRPERRFLLRMWWQGKGAKIAVAAYWFPTEQVVKELRGTAVSTIGTTSAEDEALSVTWLDECQYSAGLREQLEREIRKFHRGLLDAKECSG